MTEHAALAWSRVRAVDVPVERPMELAGGALTSNPMVLIELRDADGVAGRSYLRSYSTLALRPLALLVEDLLALMAGRPADPGGLEAAVPASLRLLGLRGLVGHALAGIDMALWDLRATAAGVPLASLLGATIERVPAYRVVGARTPHLAADEAGRALGEGLRAVKVKLGGQPAEDDATLVAAVREAVGPEALVMGDFNQSLTPDEALRRAEQLDDLGLAWVEEPLAHDDLVANRRLADALRTPLQLGENLEGPVAVARSIDAGASDLLMLDAMKVGGVTGWMRASRIAAAAGMRVSSHAYPEFSRHLLAASPTAHWLEAVDHLAPLRGDALPMADGHVPIPATPGAGLAWDEDRVRRYG